MVKANPEMPPEERHRLAPPTNAIFQIVIMTKGWARFMYEDKATLVQAGDVVHHGRGSCTISSITHRTWSIRNRQPG